MFLFQGYTNICDNLYDKFWISMTNQQSSKTLKETIVSNSSLQILGRDWANLVFTGRAPSLRLDLSCFLSTVAPLSGVKVYKRQSALPNSIQKTSSYRWIGAWQNTNHASTEIVRICIRCAEIIYKVYVAGIQINNILWSIWTLKGQLFITESIFFKWIRHRHNINNITW